MDIGTTDIFATKGIEYLIVIAYLVVLIGAWRLLREPEAARAVAQRVPLVGGWFHVRDDIYFHQGHSWAAPDEGDVLTVGMDDFARKLLGPPEAIELPEVGTRLKQGEHGWQIQVDSRSVDMLSPVDGEVIQINREVVRSPELVSEPYDRGWLMKVRVPNRRRNLKNLLKGNLARAWMRETVETLRAMEAGQLGIVMPDGGVPVDGFVRVLAPENWDEVARKFLLSDD